MRKIFVGELYHCMWAEWGTYIHEVCLVIGIKKFYHGFENPNQYTVLRSNGKTHQLHSNGIGEVIR
jgi:hypothetical protein